MRTFAIITLLSALSLNAAAQQPGTDVIQLALDRHPKILAARAAVEAEKAGRGELLSPYRPMVSLNAYAAGGNGSMIFNSTVEPKNQAMLPSDGVLMGNLMLMWKVWTGGRESSARALGSARIEAMEHMLATVEQDVVLGVRLASSEYQYSIGALEAANAVVAAAMETHRTAQLMEDAGKAPRAFVLRAAANAKMAEQVQAMAEAEVASARAMLEEAVGGPFEGKVTLQQIPQPMPETLQGALQESGNRRELKFFAASAEAFGFESDYVRRSLRPEVSVMAMGMSMETSGGMSDRGAKFGIVFSVPITDGGMRTSKARMLEARAKEFLAQGEDARLMVRREVQSAWSRWAAADKVLESAEAGLAAAIESFEVEKLRFESGKSVVSELLESVAALNSARLASVSAQKYKSDSAARLVRAVGR